MRHIAEALAAWCGATGVNGSQLARFYKQHDGALQTVSIAKVPGQPKGIRSFVSLHSDILTCQFNDNGDLRVKAKMKTLSLDSDVSELATALNAMKVGGTLPLATVNNLLEPIKDGASMRQFAHRVKAAGLCLTDGKFYGTQLPHKLKQAPALRVNKKAAKEYPLVKKCLVHLCR